MLILIALLTLAKFLKYIIYHPIYWFLKWQNPTRKYTVPSSRIKEIIRPVEHEWQLDAVRNDEILSFSGSSANGGVVYIQVLTAESVHHAHIYLLENGEKYEGSFSAHATDKNAITCGPLLLELRSPFRCWRISFRGHLFKTSSSVPNFVTICGWWKCVSNNRFFYSNTPLSAFFDIFEKNKFAILENVRILEKYRTSNILNQMGEFHAEVKIDNKVSEQRYRGLRERLPLEMSTTSTQFSAYLSNGNSFSHRIANHNNDSKIDHGLFFRSSHSVVPINLGDETCLDESNMRPITFNVKNDLPFEIRKGELVSNFSFTRNDDKIINVSLFTINHALSTGTAIVTRTRKTLNKVEKIELESFPEYRGSKSETSRKVLPFSHRACQDKTITGGKGANLARLQAITNGYHVPSGIVVTTVAFDKHLTDNQDINSLVHKLETPGQTNEFYEEIGKRIEEHLKTSEISEQLKSEILELLPPAEFYAVRSSAVGEDGADLSSAGQLESFLDTKLQYVFHNLKLCWASNFRKEVLNYRRNYGQQLNPSMAVVIQEMNRNGVSGVMFTANPVTFDRGEIVINALKGIGELIVSGVETPDEINVNRIDSKIKIKTSGSSCCLNEDDINALRKVGEHLEKFFGKPQDIEFVMKNKQINIVQSRDITGLDKESAFEMYHELDTPTFTDKEILTNGNVGEVLPAPINAMEAFTSTIMFDKVICCMTLREIKDVIPAHTTVGFAINHRKVFVNLGEIVLRIWEIVQKDRITDIVFAGELLFNDEMFKQSADRFGNMPKTMTTKRLINMIKIIFYSSYKILENIKKVAKEAEKMVPNENASVEEIFETNDKLQYLWCDAIQYHTEQSVFSSFTYVICGMLIRGSEYGSLSDDDISDFANVFSNNARSDVISADVPNSLKKIASAIKDDGLVDQFNKSSGEQAMEILRKGEKSSKQLARFLELHGHRGPKELYLDAVTWAENTDLLIHTIKSMILCPQSNEKKIETEDSIIDGLKCQPKGIRRKMLKYFIKQTHRGVAFRESAKNHLVFTGHCVRKTFRLLGQKLFEKGYLPDPSLWMHLNIDELKELNQTRNPKLISRAVRRKQIAGKFEGLQFPLMSHGHMNPLKQEEDLPDQDLTSKLVLKGTIVCEGKVIAKARVAKTLEEAKQTEPGEILITRYTDICWSPFFPIVGGIVTEIGGLLSHGAVVAREYGLPSLIAVNNATKYFKTGDLVELDSVKGTISRLERGF